MMKLIKRSTLWKVPFILTMILPVASLANMKVLNMERVLDINQRIVFIDNNACKYIGELREVSPGNGAVIVSLKQCGDTVSNVKMAATPVNKNLLPVPTGTTWTLTE